MSQDLINALNANRVNAVALGDSEGVKIIDSRIAELEEQAEQDLSSLKVAELKELAEAQGIDTEGLKKADLVEALEGTDNGDNA